MCSMAPTGTQEHRPNLRPLLTVSELAVILGRSRWTVNRWLNSDNPPFEVIKTLGVRQVRRTDVETFLNLPAGSLAEAS